jgi:hypothetical protein
MNKRSDYLKKESDVAKIVRAEILFTPILVVLPLIVGVLLVSDWYFRGFIEGGSGFEGQLILGLIIIFGNIMFDIPFIKSLRELTKAKNNKK